MAVAQEVAPTNDQAPLPIDTAEALRSLLGVLPSELDGRSNSGVTEQLPALSPGEIYNVAELRGSLVIDWHTPGRSAEQTRGEAASAGAGIVAVQSEIQGTAYDTEKTTLRGSIQHLVNDLAVDPAVHSMGYSAIGRRIDDTYRSLPRGVRRQFRKEHALLTGESGPIQSRLGASVEYHILARAALADALEAHFDRTIQRAETGEGAIVLRADESQTTIRRGELEQALGFEDESDALAVLGATKGLDTAGLRIVDASKPGDQPAMSVSVSPKALVTQLLAESSDHEAFLDAALPSLLGMQEAQRQSHRAHELLDQATKNGLPIDHSDLSSVRGGLVEADAMVIRESLAIFRHWLAQESRLVRAGLAVQLASKQAEARVAIGAQAADQIGVQCAGLQNQLEKCFGTDGNKLPSVVELRTAKQFI